MIGANKKLKNNKKKINKIRMFKQILLNKRKKLSLNFKKKS